jgi:ubiquinone/menaquinone biosynthesis C-methylase UbiE
MSTSQTVGTALDQMFDRAGGLYGALEDLPVISQKGHYRRGELLARLEIGDVSRMTCVDFGMGSWAFAANYPRLHACASAIGLDISEHALRLSEQLVARTQPPYARSFRALQSDGMTLPLADRSVDLFFSGESIEHVRFPPRFLSEVYRVLAPGGQLVVTTPNRDAIGYLAQGEEYCTSPEHFWLFNHAELVAMVSEFFEIREIYGFNGSFGPNLDASITDERRAEAWCRRFEDQPQLATGIVLRAVKREDVSTRYEIADIPGEAIEVVGADRRLPLEFGLRGLLLDAAEMRVTIRRPASDGIVCRFWSHRWSGHAALESLGRTEVVDLYSLVPGWENWLFPEPTDRPSTVTIRPAMRRNPKAENDQVIFFESFTWRRIGETPNPPAWSAQTSPQAPGVERLTEGDGFARLQTFVATTVFHWFTPTAGNRRGPWRPLGGRESWTGEEAFWRDQIKQIMMANIDAVYLHCIDKFEEQRMGFFRAYAALRREGWDVPKLAPFLDPFYLWREAPIDVATSAGKDEFVRHYIRFFEQYLAANADPMAESYLLRIDGRIVLTTWWVAHLLRNVQSLSRRDVERRIAAALAARLPALARGIHMMTTALIDPDLVFSDERMVMFAGYAYAIHSVHNTIDVWHVQPGYWDQNIRKPGYLMPRDGGRNYRRAWEIVAANMPNVQRVYVESWNEYDEGSGIYAADPSAPFRDAAMHDEEDVFSDRGDPFEYIRTTAAGAARVNGRPAHDARILHHTAPPAAARGERFAVTVTVRNQGNASWRGRDGIGLAILRGTEIERVVPLLDHQHEISLYDGVFRGRPVTFTFTMDAPDNRVDAGFIVSMVHGEALFGERRAIPLATD